MPLATYEGWTLQNGRDAVAAHRQGLFIASPMIAGALLGVPEVFMAFRQRIQPLMMLKASVQGAPSGLAGDLRANLELQLAQKGGSEYFPSSLRGSIGYDLIWHGFAVLQHAFGDPDPETGIRPLYTRRWPIQSVRYYQYRRAFVAITTNGDVDITNDGKFTLIADSEEPHLMGALIPLLETAIDLRMTTRARGGYIDIFAKPKPYGKMPEGVGTNTPEGEKFLQILEFSKQPGSLTLLPYGADMGFAGLQPSQNDVFQSAIDYDAKAISKILLGSDGTSDKGSAGVYASPVFAAIKNEYVSRDLACVTNGIEQGHVQTWLHYNYEETIKAEREKEGWQDPHFDIPLPDLNLQERAMGKSARTQALLDILMKERLSGCEVTQDRVHQLALAFEVDEPKLAELKAAQVGLAPSDYASVLTVDEIRAMAGVGPLGDERGAMLKGEFDTTTEGDEASTKEGE